MLLQIGTAVAALFAASYITKAIKTKNAGDKLKSEIDGITYKGIKSGKINIDLTFKHTNPTNEDLKFDYMFLDILVGDSKIASIRQEALNKVVAKNAVTIQTIPLTISLLSLGLSLLNIITTGKLPQTVKVVGNIKVNDFITEYNQVYPLKIA